MLGRKKRKVACPTMQRLTMERNLARDVPTNVKSQRLAGLSILEPEKEKTVWIIVR